MEREGADEYNRRPRNLMVSQPKKPSEVSMFLDELIPPNRSIASQNTVPAKKLEMAGISQPPALQRPVANGQIHIGNDILKHVPTNLKLLGDDHPHKPNEDVMNVVRHVGPFPRPKDDPEFAGLPVFGPYEYGGGAYKGQFKDGLPHGFGTFTSRNTHIEGFYRNGKLDGFAVKVSNIRVDHDLFKEVYRTDDGRIDTVTTIVAKVKEGKLPYCLTGEFKGGFILGEGTCEVPGHYKFTGFIDEKRGYAVGEAVSFNYPTLQYDKEFFYWSDSFLHSNHGSKVRCVYKGKFVDFMKDGFAEVIMETGERYRQFWKDGELLGEEQVN